MSRQDIVRKSFGDSNKGTVFMCHHCGYESTDDKEWNEEFPTMFSATDKTSFALIYSHTCPKCGNRSMFEFNIVNSTNSKEPNPLEDQKYYTGSLK